jgi:serine/threonine protein kinase/dienelactone hydrolase
MSLSAGKRFGSYEIVALIGKGGMGEVYRARDTKLRRDIAIKVLPDEFSRDDDRVSRFQREAEILASLNHPNIAAIYDFAEFESTRFLVLELVAGESLDQTLKRGPMPILDVVHIAAQVCEALEASHEQGVIHRDLKPANICVDARRRVKVLDFGIARILGSPEGPTAAATAMETQGVIGTIAYMSPEQAAGKPIDFRTDLWSLGVVLYEMLTGSLPFEGDSIPAMMHALTHELQIPLRKRRADVPEALARLVAKALEKDPSKRFASASAMRQELSKLMPGANPALQRPAGILRLRYLVPAALLFLLTVGAAVWFYKRSANQYWAHEVAIPQITKFLSDDKPLAAMLLAEEAERYIPGDVTLSRALAESTRTVSIDTDPPGATVEVKDYLSPETSWHLLGTAPLHQIRIPNGYLQWRIAKPGAGELVVARPALDSVKFQLEGAAKVPDGMLPVQGGPWLDYLSFLGWVGPYNLPAFYIDRFEVTNRQYQDFVDKGGYQKREYWKMPFIRDGRELSWDEAMTLLRDTTGRPGPSTWEAGHYPEGKADYPVSGVSWFEAAAYLESVAKSLPAIAQWYKSEPPLMDRYVARLSNFSSPAPVGQFKGLGPYGTYDMVGNVREWCLNTLDQDLRFIPGRVSNSYGFDALSPFDRSPENGFRGVRNSVPLAADITAPRKSLRRDFATAQPASDTVFRVYKSLYSYEPKELNAKIESEEDSRDWKKQKVTFDAAYAAERVTAYLFLPKNSRPPYQTIVFFPSARILGIPTSQTLGDLDFVDYVIKSGRAVLYPVYKGTYERLGPSGKPTPSAARDMLVQQSKDLGRSIDYLESRADIDKSRIGYLGVSMGTAYGVIFTSLEDRLKTVVFLDGGFFRDEPFHGMDQVDFAPRLKKPVLLVGGRYDATFPIETSQNPMFSMLGTPDRDKRHVVLESPHDVREQRPTLTKEVLAWLDKYLGPVN